MKLPKLKHVKLAINDRKTETSGERAERSHTQIPVKSLNTTSTIPIGK